MSDRAGDAQEDEFDPRLLPWQPVTRRGWILLPGVIVLLSLLVLAATHGVATTALTVRLTDGWRVAALAALCGAVILAVFGRRAYIEVSETAARQNRRAFVGVGIGLALTLAVTGAVSGSSFLASSSLSGLLLFAVQARAEMVRLLDRRPARARGIALGLLALGLLGLLGASWAAFLSDLPGPSQGAVVGDGVVYGTIAIVASILLLRRITRLRRGLRGPA
ncbi:hypothetical protein GCM10022256_03820 [Frondihabitans peucedani]|uniref:Uncharacterized protein n=1 Tax=Frondihabitans peucedani TaxID=598626 RepID=A0ABP8DXS8_9MICO